MSITEEEWQRVGKMVRALAVTRSRQLQKSPSPLDADDLFQEGMAAAWRAIGRYDAAKTRPLYSWCYEAAKWAICDAMRDNCEGSQRTENGCVVYAKRETMPDYWEPSTVDPPPAESVTFEQQVRRIDPHMPERDLKLLVLVFVEGRDRCAAFEALGGSRAKSSQVYARVMSRLKTAAWAKRWTPLDAAEALGVN